MATFVRCTEGRDLIYLNLALVVQMRRIGDNTETRMLLTNGHQLTVRETPEELMKAGQPK